MKSYFSRLTPRVASEPSEQMPLGLKIKTQVHIKISMSNNVSKSIIMNKAFIDSFKVFDVEDGTMGELKTKVL